ncbi:metallophosphoesterase family protein [Breznakiella homolactica]|uniref:Metallophosphoesterase family protein n=1 Tax=Breznakiella homolactica TaxID=2798577 RepID=A0A7T7XMD8_9SPIR|nr:metallophosphoesterase family protein [Breznakiella homolactica]QQO09046.1 metallophosphatase family protein [Breznakiella homolactica]
MRVLVVSDIHANIAAFEAVLKQEKNGYDAVLCLGDIVGYGPYPNECVELVSEVCTVTLAGNHDLAASGGMDISAFSARAKKAVKWTRSRLSGKNRLFLESLVPLGEYQGVLLSHGGPENPVWSYVISEMDAAVSFGMVNFNDCLFGHTHIPSAFIQPPEDGTDGTRRIEVRSGVPDSPVEQGPPGTRRLLNPGSVGFPRDTADAHRDSNLDHAAARYGTFDTGTGLWIFRRTEYDMNETAMAMMKAGLW